LDQGDIERKLVGERQGGYCFEQNLLLRAGLQQLGFEVDMLLARARIGGWPGPIRPRTHLMLRVWIDDRPWLADVGFGFGGLLEPLPFAAGGPYEQSGWRFRVVWDEPELVMQTARGDEWSINTGWSPVRCRLPMCRPPIGSLRPIQNLRSCTDR